MVLQVLVGNFYLCYLLNIRVKFCLVLNKIEGLKIEINDIYDKF